MNHAFQAKKRCIDVVFCIDGTGSMSPCIEKIKENVGNFYTDFKNRMNERGSEFDLLRAKVIVFRDYKYSSESAMQESPFFELPAEQSAFESFVSGMSAYGGGDIPENGLEALYFAMKSDFLPGFRNRRTILLLTDADALDLLERKSCEGYPSDMVDEDGLVDFWNNCLLLNSDPPKSLRRYMSLAIFAPGYTNYEYISRRLERTVLLPTESMNGLSEIDYGAILTQLVVSSCVTI